MIVTGVRSSWLTTVSISSRSARSRRRRSRSDATSRLPVWSFRESRSSSASSIRT
jgi:hypothetical protein